MITITTLMKVVSFIVKIHLLHKAVYKFEVGKISQCMYSIRNKRKQEKDAENVSNIDGWPGGSFTRIFTGVPLKMCLFPHS